MSLTAFEQRKTQSDIHVRTTRSKVWKDSTVWKSSKVQSALRQAYLRNFWNQSCRIGIDSDQPIKLQNLSTECWTESICSQLKRGSTKNYKTKTKQVLRITSHGFSFCTDLIRQTVKYFYCNYIYWPLLLNSVSVCTITYTTSSLSALPIWNSEILKGATTRQGRITERGHTKRVTSGHLPETASSHCTTTDHYHAHLFTNH